MGLYGWADPHYVREPAPMESQYWVTYMNGDTRLEWLTPSGVKAALNLGYKLWPNNVTRRS